MLTLSRILFLGLLCASASFAAPHSENPQPGTAPKAQVSQIALHFEPQAQHYVARGPGYKLQLDTDGATVWLQSDPKQAHVDQLTLRFANSAMVSPNAQQRLAGVSNYLIGNTPEQWQIGVAHFAQVVYPDLYPGVTAVFYGQGRQLEYDFQVAPGADPASIVLDFQGAKSIRLSEDGALHLALAGGELIQHAPQMYQLRADGSHEAVSGGYRLLASENAMRVAFQIDRYDSERALIIDPVLSYSSYFGGTGDEGFEGGVAVDSSGNILLAGWTGSTDFPNVNAAQSSFGGWIDAVVVKLDPTGQQVLYSTYLGGKLGIANAHYVNGYDYAYSIAVDAAGNAYITGKTSSPDFPVSAGAYDTTCGVNGLCDYPANALNDTRDGFVTKLSPSGALIYSSFLGGSGNDIPDAISVDSAGNAIVTGWTSSLDFPVLNAVQASRKGSIDAFVTKLNPDGTALVYSTYLGGAVSGAFYSYYLYSYGTGVAVDGAGNAYVLGHTSTTDFPITSGSYQTAYAGGYYDGFVTKLSPGGALACSTFIGGEGTETSAFIALDTTGAAYITGATNSYAYPVFSPVQSSFAGGSNDVFVSRLNADGSALLYSTYLGGSGNDVAYGIAVDAYDRAHVSGYTDSTNFPVKNPVQATNKGGLDAFLAKLNTGGTSLVYSTYLGGATGVFGPANEISYGVALDASGAKAHIAGATQASDFPTVNPYQATLNKTYGISDAFVSVISDDTPGSIAPDLAVSIAHSPAGVNIGQNLSYSIRVVNGGNADATNVVLTDPLPPNVGFVSATSSQGSCSLVAGSVSCALGNLARSANASVSVTITPSAATLMYNTVSVSAAEAEISNLNNSATDAVTVFGNIDLALALTDSPDPAFIGNNITYVLSVANIGIAPATNVVVSDTLPTSLSFVSVATTQGSCTQQAGVVSCALGTVVNGASATLTLVATPSLGGYVSNSMSASASEADANLANNSASADTMVQAYADLVQSSVDAPPPAPSQAAASLPPTE